MSAKNIEDLCRICVQESHSYKHIYSHFVEDAYLYEVMNALCNLDICSVDGLPEYICGDCYHKVLEFRKFKKTCHDGTAALVGIKMKYGTEEMTIDPREIKTEVYMDEICDQGMDDLRANRGVDPDDRQMGAQEVCGAGKEAAQGIHREGGADVKGEEVIDLIGVNGFKVIPVGLVKCPLDEMGVDDGRGVVGTRRDVEEGSEVAGDVIVSGSEEGSRSRLDPSLVGDLLCGVEGYNQIGVIRPPHVDPPRQNGNSHRCGRPFGDHIEGIIARRAQDGSRSAGIPAGTGRHPPVGRDRPGTTGYECPHCGKSISRRFDFESHLRIHSGIKPFGCHVCHAAFNLKKRLKAHMNVHLAMKLFICAYCRRKFKSKDALSLHMYVHGGERPPDGPTRHSEVWCGACGVHGGPDHARWHARDLECRVCGLTCRDADDLGAHKLSHEHEKKFQCTKCGKRYGLKGNLAQHMMTHTDDKRFSCLNCERRFYTASRLRRHQLVHSAERNVACSECGRAFKSKHYLRQHQRTHQSGAVHVCRTCGQRYKWQGDLRKHCRLKDH